MHGPAKARMILIVLVVVAGGGAGGMLLGGYATGGTPRTGDFAWRQEAGADATVAAVIPDAELPGPRNYVCKGCGPTLADRQMRAYAGDYPGDYAAGDYAADYGAADHVAYDYGAPTPVHGAGKIAPLPDVQPASHAPGAADALPLPKLEPTKLEIAGLGAAKLETTSLIN